MEYVRVTEPAALRHPETGEFVVPDPRKAYRSDDPLVKAFPWAFASDADAAGVEQATRAPGERRQTRR